MKSNMDYGPSLETHPLSGNSTSSAASTNGAQTERSRNSGLKRALIFAGIAAISAGVAFVIVRATLSRPPQDPTTERIQGLIDEANRLLKQLDERKPG